MRPPNSNPYAAEVGKLRSYLAIHKVPPSIANDLVKMTKTRKQNADDITAYLKSVTK